MMPASFEIRTDDETGEVTLWLKADGDVPAPGGSWDITLTVTDKGGLSLDASLDITRNGLFLTRSDTEGGANIYTDGAALIDEELVVRDQDPDADANDNFVQITVNGHGDNGTAAGGDRSSSGDGDIHHGDHRFFCDC